MYGREFHEWQETQEADRRRAAQPSLASAVIRFLEHRADEHIRDAMRLLEMARQNRQRAAETRDALRATD